MPIHFGTDGWTAVISDTFTFDNLRIVAQAIADAVGSEHWLNGKTSLENVDYHKMVVGYDTRFLSDRYAVDMARVLAANGYKVLLSQSDSPTPVISFAVRQQGAIGGVMITASHNAPRYNGVKLKAAYGGSALPEQCRRVEVYLNDNEERGRARRAKGSDQQEGHEASRARPGTTSRGNDFAIGHRCAPPLAAPTGAAAIDSKRWSRGAGSASRRPAVAARGSA